MPNVPLIVCPLILTVREGNTVVPEPFTPPFWYTSVLEVPVAIVNIWFVVELRLADENRFPTPEETLISPACVYK
jgi:hypothetical protein